MSQMSQSQFYGRHFQDRSQRNDEYEKEDPVFEYGEHSKMFVQSMMCRGFVPKAKAHELFDIAIIRVFGAEHPYPWKGMDSKAERDKKYNESFKKFLKVINDTFEEYDIQLRFETIYDEEKTRRVGGLALVNRTDCSAEESKMTIKSSICYSPAELEYLKIILRYIMTSDDKSISSTFALNRISEMQVKKLTQHAADEFLERLKEDKWMRFDEKNPRIRMTPRFVKEMEPYLKDVYGDFINKCRACQTSVIKSIECPNDECDAHYHLYCISLIADRDTRGNVPMCMECHQQKLPRKFERQGIREMEQTMQVLSVSTSGSTSASRAGQKRKGGRVISGLDSDSD